MIADTVILGLRLACGSWKTICIVGRTCRNSRPEMLLIGFPPTSISPAVISWSRRIDRPTVDFPQPDSPTRPSVSPSWISNDTSSTAFTSPTFLRKTPARIGKCIFNPRTLTSGVDVPFSAIGRISFGLVEETCDVMIVRDVHPGRIRCRASRECARTPWLERTGSWSSGHDRWLPRQLNSGGCFALP